MSGDRDYRAELGEKVGEVVAILTDASAAGVELDPLESILTHLRESGQELDMSEMPPMMRMLLGGMGV